MSNKWKDVRWKVPEPDEPSEDVGEENEEESEPEADIPEEAPEEPVIVEDAPKPAKDVRAAAFDLIAGNKTLAQLEAEGYDAEACKAEKLRILRGE